MSNETEDRRRANPPCDLHEMRIAAIEKRQDGMHVTMYGEDGRNGLVGDQAYTKGEVKALVKLVWLTLPPTFIAVIILLLKEFLSKGA